MSRTLVIRLSAIGDVAMLIPVLFSVAKHYPQDSFVVMTKKNLLSLFDYRPHNVSLFVVDTQQEHKGIKGLYTLIRQLSALQLTAIADTHQVLRSTAVRLFFKAKGLPTAVINKGRKEKKALTRKNNKIRVPLQTTIERYQAVFKRLGYHCAIDFSSIFDWGEPLTDFMADWRTQYPSSWIGIAPFAKHQAKMYPLHQMEQVVQSLSETGKYTLFLFGSKSEAPLLEQWAQQYPQVISVAGKLRFSTELALMQQLQLMLSMDSANMHLASLVNTPVVSVWGATHSFAGFTAYRQSPNRMVQIDTLDCRPCSIFGDKPCYRKDYACMQQIRPQQIINTIQKVLLDNEGSNPS